MCYSHLIFVNSLFFYIILHTMDMSHCEVVICKDVLQGLQKNSPTNINQFNLLGINLNEKNVSKSYIIGFVDSSFNVDDNYPHNLIACGVSGKAEQIEDIQQHFLKNDQLNKKPLLYLNITDSQIQLLKLEKNHGDIESKELEFQVQIKEELSNSLLYLRTCMRLELDRKINDTDSSYIASLLEKKIGLKPLFYIKDYDQFLGSKSKENKNIGELKSKTNKLDYEVLNITVYQNLSNAQQTENVDVSDFPIIHQTNEPYDEKLVCCQLDALCVVPKCATYTQTYNLLYGSIIKNVKSIQSFLVSNPNDLPAVHHFWPDTLCHFVTIVCSHNQIDSYNNLRKKLHSAFYLSTNKPLFRISNAYIFDRKSIINDDGLLTNVHEGLPSSGSNDITFKLKKEEELQEILRRMDDF